MQGGTGMPCPHVFYPCFFDFVLSYADIIYHKKYIDIVFIGGG
jgi:hypothetical protein